MDHMEGMSATQTGVATAVRELLMNATLATTGVVDARERAPDVIKGWCSVDVEALKNQVCGAVIKGKTGDALYRGPLQNQPLSPRALPDGC